MVVEEHIFTEFGKEDGELYLPETLLITCGRLTVTIRKALDQFNHNSDDQPVLSNPQVFLEQNNNKIGNNEEIMENQTYGPKIEDKTFVNEQNKQDNKKFISENDDNESKNEEVKFGIELDRSTIYKDISLNNEAVPDARNKTTEDKPVRNSKTSNDQSSVDIANDTIGQSEGNIENETNKPDLMIEYENEEKTFGNGEDMSKFQHHESRSFENTHNGQITNERVPLASCLQTVEEEPMFEDEALMKDPYITNDPIPVVEEPEGEIISGSLEHRKGKSCRRKLNRKIIKNTVVIEEINDNFEDYVRHFEEVEPIVDEGMDIEELPDVRDSIDVVELTDDFEAKKDIVTKDCNSQDEQSLCFGVGTIMPKIINKSMENNLDCYIEKGEEGQVGKEVTEEHQFIGSEVDGSKMIENTSSKRVEVEEKSSDRNIHKKDSPCDGKELSPSVCSHRQDRAARQGLHFTQLLVLFLPLLFLWYYFLQPSSPPAHCSTQESKTTVTKASCVLDGYIQLSNLT